MVCLPSFFLPPGFQTLHRFLLVFQRLLNFDQKPALLGLQQVSLRVCFQEVLPRLAFHPARKKSIVTIHTKVANYKCAM